MYDRYRIGHARDLFEVCTATLGTCGALNTGGTPTALLELARRLGVTRINYIVNDNANDSGGHHELVVEFSPDLFGSFPVTNDGRLGNFEPSRWDPSKLVGTPIAA